MQVIALFDCAVEIENIYALYLGHWLSGRLQAMLVGPGIVFELVERYAERTFSGQAKLEEHSLR
jgi:hypothetical protein